ncbi:terminase large subunit [Rhizobium laguerreae]|uniref:terminase large subunit n=1 Tax=Rhizobium laguerreae TaxID=1076926 RepID=UPI001C92B638|nr:terminase TerL endonuclease subunit [Rhizobium laguerreae]MBY3257074.1 terminase large subunit [Rhizobium laguerreae]MBY3282435.1 terminase large subunit [Rhizobium laguerreae]MBY3291962.1 terminase large subunit [Rhizobium laguerreae]
MAVRVGKAAHRKGPRRPLGVGGKATWDHDRKAWCEGDYWFDEAASVRAVAFFPEHLCFTKGEWAGKPFHLEDWQANDIVRPIFGWKRPDGTRRYRRVYVWVPRKNGKTELAAGIALLILLGDGELGGEVYSIASHEGQARLVFGQAATMVGKSLTLSNDLVSLKSSIYCPALNASFKPLSGKAEGKHGFSASGLIGDEIHEWTSGDLYQFVHDSEDARRQPLEFLISTAGKKGTYGEEVWDECQKILDGTYEDPETLVVVYAADPDDDWQSEKTWRKANPNLGVSKKLDTMRTNARRARQLPRLENHFKNYHLNIWTEQAVRWLPIDATDDDGNKFGWDHCKGPIHWSDLAERLDGKRCFGGLDLSSTNDLSAIVWWFPAQRGLEIPVVVPRFFKPAATIKEHAKRDRLPYEQWAKDGALMTTPGNVVDYEFIRKQIYADAERFKIAHVGNAKREAHEGGIAIDRWNATETAVKLEQEGLPVVLFGQGYGSMSAPSKELERLVLGNGFHHGGHPVLRRHAQVVAIEGPDAADNIKPAKNKSNERIDGIVAQVMAIGIATKDDGDDSGKDDYFNELARAA